MKNGAFTPESRLEKNDSAPIERQLLEQKLAQPPKLMCIWWNKDLVYNELLPRNATITADVYFQLRRLEAGIQVILHDNAHTANITFSLFS